MLLAAVSATIINIHDDKHKVEAIINDGLDKITTSLFITAENILRDTIYYTFGIPFDTLDEYYQIDPINSKGNESEWVSPTNLRLLFGKQFI